MFVFFFYFFKVQYKSIKSFHVFLKWMLSHHHHHHQWLNVKRLTNNHLSRHHYRKEIYHPVFNFVLSAWLVFFFFIYFLISGVCVYPRIYFICLLPCFSFQWLTGESFVHSSFLLLCNNNNNRHHYLYNNRDCFIVGSLRRCSLVQLCAFWIAWLHSLTPYSIPFDE